MSLVDVFLLAAERPLDRKPEQVAPERAEATFIEAAHRDLLHAEDAKRTVRRHGARSSS